MLLSKIKGWLSVLFKSKAQDEFNLKPIGSEQMLAWIDECIHIYRGDPCWLDEADDIDTVNFAKAVCSETARLVTLGIGIQVDGSARAEWLKTQLDRIYYRLRDWVEYGCAYGTVILKPDGSEINLYTPDEFEIVHQTDGKIDGVIFHHWEQVGDKWYTRLEYHEKKTDAYKIENRCFVGNERDDTKQPVRIELTPWAGIEELVELVNITSTLFGVLRTPQANNIDLDSPYGLPVFSEAVQELKDLDIAYSRNAKEVFDSKRIVMADDSLLAYSGERIPKSASEAQNKSAMAGFPSVVKMVSGTGPEAYYQEINPELNTDTRIKGINALLNQIGYKSGYSNGHFVFNESGGIQTATQVEADQQRTIQTIKDTRDKLEDCITNLIYALDVFAELYNLAPSGTYEVAFDFGDITYSREEDRARWWGYVTYGKVPAWKYFVKFEGMTEKEAKEMVAEASAKQPGLFDPEE